MSKISIALFLWVLSTFYYSNESPKSVEEGSVVVADSFRPQDIALLSTIVDEDTSKKKNPNNRVGDATRQRYVTPLYLGNPSNVKTSFQLEKDLSGYTIYEKVGSVDFRAPSFISFDEYVEYRKKQGIRTYFRDQSLAANNENRQGLQLDINVDELSDVFGGGTISIRPTGYATIDLGIDNNKTDNPSLPLRQQSTTTFNFDQQIQLGVIGQIGEKLRLNVNFDTQATFDFENELKLEHTGSEDQILQKIEAGNVNMQLGNSLIQGRQNLFGLKTLLKFGPVYVTGIASSERGKVENVSISGGGAIETPFEKEASEYDQNRHFFLSHYFRSKYENALSNLPVIQSTLRINRVEVWVQQQGATVNTRNAIGFIDLGENENPIANGQGVVYNDGITQSSTVRYPDNEANNLYELLTANASIREQSSAKPAIEALPGLNMKNTEDFEILGNMRRLDPNEYRLNSQLGYISLNSPVPNGSVLFVAFNYTLNGNSFQVGEFSDDVPANSSNSNVLYAKMLKSSVLRVNTGQRPYPAWDLMMKNVYNIGYGLQREGFFLDIKYESGTSAGKINFLPTGAVANRPLIQVTGLDRVTNHTAPGPDNFFDFIEGITIVADRGLVIFPVLEPFGSYLTRALDNDQNEVAKYVFQPLYDDTQQGAIQGHPELNRYSLEGYYQSAGGSEIPLNTFNLAEGSVTVTAGGRPLTEGVDYQVDYFGGKVTIINPAILSSGQDINVSYESSSLYQVQTKTLLGARAEYSPNDNLSLGLTAVNLREQPFNQKLTLGDEPINNTLWGIDATLIKESDFLTKAIDKLPLITTKETSTINAAFEAAQFVPGVPKVVRNSRDKGIVYLDDFEAAATPFSLQGQQRWRLASFPEGNPQIVDPTTRYPSDSLAANFTRAKLAWYQIDQAFFQRFGIDFPDEDLRNNYTRQIQPWEIFPTATRAFGQNIQTTFDLRYIPTLRGPYNYQTDPNQLENDGTFTHPEENWAGIMREIDINTDFEATNVEFIEFWMMDPFMANPAHEGGEFYINLGLVNEDLLPDQNLSRENGLPGPPPEPDNTRNTPYGRVSIGNPTVNAFSTDKDKRKAQDIGLDGLNSEAEVAFFANNFLNLLQGNISTAAFARLQADPSSDDFLHFRDDTYEAAKAGILERYLQYNGTEGNSPVGEDRRNYTIQATQQPDTEDLNENGSLNFAEQYWEYKIDLHRNAMIVGQNFIVDRIDTTVRAGNRDVDVTWYQFRVPLNAGRPVNNIANFKSINFMRMYFADFKQEIITRLTEFQLVSTQWRRFTGDLTEDGPVTTPPEPPFASFELGSVSVEENSTKLPFNYTTPPGIERQSLNGNTLAGYLQDERSLVLKVCDLEDGDARSIFKTTKHDLRQYDRLRLFVHAESVEDGLDPSNFYERGDATVFLRLGLDNDFNYYEYEIPLTPSQLGSQADFNIWPSENEFDFELALFALAKADRNTKGTGLIYRHEFVDTLAMPEGHRIYIKGTPKLSDVRNIMIGVRNPEDPSGERICLEVWVNELRLTNFDKAKGYAANANMSVRLADLGTINASGSFKTAGFGPLEQKISGRPQEDQMRYDLAANLTMDKFFPKKWGLSLPVYATFGEQRINPQFNPQEADVRTDKLIEALNPEQAKEKLKEIQDYRRTRSVSFNNWRKTKGLQQPRPPGGQNNPQNQPRSWPWDISNFDFTFAYNEQLAHNAVIRKRFNLQHRAAINYRYNFPQLKVEPFKDSEKFKFLQFINFSPLPTSVNVSLTGDRQFEERQMRPAGTFGGFVDPTFTKNFLINRNYNLVWNFTRNLQLSYSANNVSRVDEVRGYWETASESERDSVGRLIDNLFSIGIDTANRKYNLVNIGRTTDFMHNYNVAYQLPFNQIRPLNWITGTINYSGSFNWRQAPEIQPRLGNTIANSQNIQANGRLDLNGLYRKVKPLRKILESSQQTARPDPRNAGPRRQPEPPKEETTTEKDSVEKPDPFKYLKIAAREIGKILLSVRSVDITYNSNNSTILPGYLPRTDNFGLDWNYYDPIRGRRSPVFAPTAGFVFGSQQDIRPIAGQNFWITQDTTLSNLYMQNLSDVLTARTSIEIFKGFRIEVSANRSFNRNSSEFYRWSPLDNNYRSFDQLANGTFSMSYIFVNTSFEKNLPFRDGSGGDPASFEAFSDNRVIISRRLSELNPYINELGQRVNGETLKGGFENGYPGTNQDVLIPALLSAYGPFSAEKISLSSFPIIPLPNWSINYNGLSSLPIFKGIFNSVSIKHTYRATYSIGNFANNLNAFDRNSLGYSSAFDDVGMDPFGPINSFYALETFQAVQISEQFAPLIGFTMNMKNGATAQIDYKRGRQMSFNIGNLQLTEMRNQDMAVMIGWRKDKLNWTFDFGGRTINLNNSLNVNFRATLRDTRERNRFLTPSGTEDEKQQAQRPDYTRGTLNFILSPSVDYVVNSRLNIKLFFERNINNPYVSTAFKTSFTSGGVQIRFTLSN